MAKDKAPAEDFVDIPLSTDLPHAAPQEEAPDFVDIPLSGEATTPAPAPAPVAPAVGGGRPSFEDAVANTLDPGRRQRLEKAAGAAQYQADQAKFDNNPGVDLGRVNSTGETITNQILSIPGAALHGIAKAGTETLSAGYHLIVRPLVQEMFNADSIPGIDEPNKNDMVGNDLAATGDALVALPGQAVDKALKPETFTGQLVSGTSQFLTSFLTWGKALKTAQALQGAPNLVQWAANAGRTAWTMGTAFDPNGGHVMDMVSKLAEDHPTLGHFVVDSLTTHKDDTDFEGRMKNVLDGVFVGTLLDGAVATFKGLKNVVTSTQGLTEGTPEYAKAAIKAVDDMHAELQQIKAQGPKPVAETSTTDDIDKLIEAAKSDAEFVPSPDDIWNSAKVEANGGAKRVLEESAQQIIPKMKGLEKQTWVQTESLAQSMDISHEELLSRLGEMGKNFDEQAAIVFRARQAQTSFAKQIEQEAKLMDNGVTPSEVGRERIRVLSNQIKDVENSLLPVRLAGARSTRQWGLSSDGVYAAQQIKAIVASGGDAQAIAKILRPLPKVSTRLWNAFNEHFSAFVLTRPITHIKNITSTVLNMVGRATEKVIGGGIQTVLGGHLGIDKAGFKSANEGLHEAIGQGEALLDAWSYFRKSLRNESSIIDPAQTKIDGQMAGHVNAISAAKLGLNPDSGMGRFITWYGKQINLPHRMLSSADDTLKMISARGNIYARAIQDGQEAGLTGDKLSAFIDSKMNNAFDESGKLVDGEALRTARMSTYTQPLMQGSIPARIGQIFNEHPITKLANQFWRTPVNVQVSDLTRTPVLQFASKTWQADFAAGGARQAEALGKIATGASMAAAASYLALGGVLVGQGPTNPAERDAWTAAGNAPYMVKLGKHSISMDALGPLGSPLKIVADFTQANKYLKEGHKLSMGAALTMAFTNRLTNNSFTQGFSDLVEAAKNPNKWDTWIQKRVSSTVVPGVAKDVRNETDPMMREVNSMWDAIKNATPGLSNTLSPVRNILGQPILHRDGGPLAPINPFVFSNETPDPVVSELVRLQGSFAMPAEVIGHVNLHDFKTKSGQDAYDRLLELRNVKVHNQDTASESFHKLITSEKYKKLSDSTNDYEGSKEKILQQEFGRVLHRDQETLQTEIPELRKAINMDKLKARQVLVKGPQGLDALTQALGIGQQQ
jgi:hypothetical protein